MEVSSTNVQEYAIENIELNYSMELSKCNHKYIFFVSYFFEISLGLNFGCHGKINLIPSLVNDNSTQFCATTYNMFFSVFLKRNPHCNFFFCQRVLGWKPIPIVIHCRSKNDAPNTIVTRMSGLMTISYSDMDSLSKKYILYVEILTTISKKSFNLWMDCYWNILWVYSCYYLPYGQIAFLLL